MSDIISFSPVRALDSNGNPVPGAQARFFRTGTTTPATVYQDVAEATPHPVPVVADANGVFPAIYRGGQALRVVVTTPVGVALPGFPLDPVITVPAQGGAAAGVSFDPTAEIPVTNVQAAIERVQLNLVAPLLAGGIGVTGNAPILSNIDALDTASGFYRWTDSSTGTFPAGWSGETGIIWLLRENVNNAIQFIARRDIDAQYVRRMEAGVWRDWVGDGSFASKPIAEPFGILDHMAGTPIPDNSGTAKFIRLSAGQSGVGEYNEGLLTDEQVSGSAPLVAATAEIMVGPMAGQRVPLVNTEMSFIRPGTDSGALQFDQMQLITGQFLARKRQGGAANVFNFSGAFSDLGDNGTDATVAANTDVRGRQTVGFSSADSPNARVSSTTSGETRPKSRQATFYMRIA